MHVSRDTRLGLDRIARSVSTVGCAPNLCGGIELGDVLGRRLHRDVEDLAASLS